MARRKTAADGDKGGQRRIRIDHSRTELENRGLDGELSANLQRLSKQQLKYQIQHDALISRVKTESASEAILRQMAKLGIEESNNASRYANSRVNLSEMGKQLRAKSAVPGGSDLLFGRPNRAHSALPRLQYADDSEDYDKFAAVRSLLQPDTTVETFSRRLQVLAEPTVPLVHLTAARLRVAQLRSERQRRETRIRYMRNKTTLADMLVDGGQMQQETNNEARRNLMQALKVRQLKADAVFSSKIRDFCRSATSTTSNNNDSRSALVSFRFDY